MAKLFLTVLTVLMALCTGGAMAQPGEMRRSGAASASETTAAAAAAARTIRFAGLIWNVKASGGALWGPGPNNFSDSENNVWVDEQGRLHLAVTHDDGVWKCAEVIAQNSFGHGTYRFTIDTPLDGLDPNVVLGLFTWNDNPAYNHREIDIEFSRWGNAEDFTNTQYVVQPYTGNGNLLRWTMQPGYGATSHSFRWTKNSVAFLSSANGNTVKQWNYTRRAGIPRPGGENPRINLWLFRGEPPLNQQPVEVIVSGFQFLP
jgi:Glycosyl hydrolases family 16